MTEAVVKSMDWFLYLLRKSMDWFLYDNGPRHERVKLHVFFWVLKNKQSKITISINILNSITICALTQCNEAHVAFTRSNTIMKTPEQCIEFVTSQP